MREDEWGPWLKQDTPASFLSRAFTNYENRLALGIPSSSILFDPSRPDLTFSSCKLVEAMGVTLTTNRGYWWMTYGQLGVLVRKTAEIIRSLVPRGSFVGICGYNGIEWAACDLACALAGCVSVGIHTTFDTASALHAIQHTDISLLFCVSDVVFESRPTCSTDPTSHEEDVILTRATTRAVSQMDFWTVQKVLELHRRSSAQRDGSADSDTGSCDFTIQHIVLLDKPMESFLASRGPESGSELLGLPLHSLIDLCALSQTSDIATGGSITDPYSSDTVAASHSLDTITSGSTGSEDRALGGSSGDTTQSSPQASQLEPPEQQPAAGREGIFTILFTSGSVGRPKGVVVSAASFFNDICSRNYVEPLVTVSYIPLSHSSDRLKMWEFLGNGGRVGFAHYRYSVILV